MLGKRGYKATTVRNRILSAHCVRKTESQRCVKGCKVKSSRCESFRNALTLMKKSNKIGGGRKGNLGTMEVKSLKMINTM